MAVLNVIHQFRDDFVALHEEYKRAVADEANPSLHNPEVGSDSDQQDCKSQDIVQRMLDLVHQLVNLIEQDDSQHHDQNKNRSQSRKTGNESAADGTYGQNEEDTALANTLGSLLQPSDIKREPRCGFVDDAEEEQSRSSNISSTGSHSSDSDVSDISEITSDQEGGGVESNPQDQIISQISKQLDKKIKNAERRVKRGPDGKILIRLKDGCWKQRTPSPDVSRSQLSKRRFMKDTEHWLTEGIPRPVKMPECKSLTVDQKRDIFGFFLKCQRSGAARAHIMERIREKYCVAVSTINEILRRGMKGQGLERRGCSGRPRVEKKMPEIIQELVSFAKANSASVNTRMVKKQFPMLSHATIWRILHDNGIKLFTASEKRALRLQQEGRPYEPYEPPEVLKLKRLIAKKRKERRLAGDLRDGRECRSKHDPSWKSWREELGIPAHIPLYSNERQRERILKKKLQEQGKIVSPAQLDAAIKAPPLRNYTKRANNGNIYEKSGSRQRKSSPSGNLSHDHDHELQLQVALHASEMHRQQQHLDDSNMSHPVSDITSSSCRDESTPGPCLPISASLPGHNQSSSHGLHPDWQVQFDPTSGNLYQPTSGKMRAHTSRDNLSQSQSGLLPAVGSGSSSYENLMASSRLPAQAFIHGSSQGASSSSATYNTIYQQFHQQFTSPHIHSSHHAHASNHSAAGGVQTSAHHQSSLNQHHQQIFDSTTAMQQLLGNQFQQQHANR